MVPKASFRVQSPGSFHLSRTPSDRDLFYFDKAERDPVVGVSEPPFPLQSPERLPSLGADTTTRSEWKEVARLCALPGSLFAPDGSHVGVIPS